MKITIERYYANRHVTKSHVTVHMDGQQEPALVCEGREPSYRDYTTDTLFKGWTAFCLPCGTMVARMRSTVYGPFTLAVGPSARRLDMLVAWHPIQQVMPHHLLLGFADETVEPERRRLTRQQEAYDALASLVREQYFRMAAGDGSGIECEVI